MRILGIILAICYAGLMIAAVCKEKSRSVSSALIAAGGVLIGGYAVLSMVWGRNHILCLVIGMISISAGALINGLKSGNLHISHHIIRFVVEAVIAAVCWIG